MQAKSPKPKIIPESQPSIIAQGNKSKVSKSSMLPDLETKTQESAITTVKGNYIGVCINLTRLLIINSTDRKYKQKWQFLPYLGFSSSIKKCFEKQI